MSARHQLQLKLAPWALLTVSAAWGLSFIVMKDAIQRQSVNNFLFTRFALAVIVMILIRPQTIKLFNKDLLQRNFPRTWLHRPNSWFGTNRRGYYWLHYRPLCGVNAVDCFNCIKGKNH